MDLIDRNAVLKLPRNITKNLSGEVIEETIDVDRIKRLPSTQPEVDEWCTNCPAYDHEKHYCPRFKKVIRRTVQEIEEERIPEHSAWFRISETLNIYPSQTRFVDNKTGVEQDEKETD